MGENENYVKLVPSSAAIKEACLDFGDGAKYAETHLREVAGLSEGEWYWEGTRLYFLTESIQPKVKSPTRPRVMLLFSNPHPESVRNGLFMSEKHSRRFWKILRNNKQLGITHDFQWDSAKEDINDTVSLLLNGDYGNDRSPLLFFECLYQIPSRSPEDLKRLFEPGTDHFKRYLHDPSLERGGDSDPGAKSYQHITTVLLPDIAEVLGGILVRPNLENGTTLFRLFNRPVPE